MDSTVRARTRSHATGAPLAARARASALGWAQTTRAEAPRQRWQAATGVPADAARGRQRYATPAARGLSCASCHGRTPTAPARHASTGQRIEPLAPAFHAERYTDQAKADIGFRRNGKEVFARECGAAEKDDVLACLHSLKP